MRAHELVPGGERVAFWAIALYETACGATVHAALMDLLTGHTLWSRTENAPLDRAILEDAAQVWTQNGWRVEQLPD